MSYRSHNQQKYQNYFDHLDQRTRENPTSLDGQILNTAAALLDDALLRYNRELSALQLLNCPTAIDNNGVYYKVSLDKNYAISSGQTSLNSIVGIKAGVNTTLNVYDDRLPIPTSYEFDSSRSQVQIPNPIIYSFVGQAGPGTNNYLTLNQEVNFQMPISNKISFWLSNLFNPYNYIQIVVSGAKYPQSPWNQLLNTDVETLTITSEGLVTTEFPWSYITNIKVIGLPTSAVLDCHSIGFNLPLKADNSRPVSLPAFRDILFNRYWKINPTNNCLEENYLLDNLSGFVYQQSYNLSTNCTCVEVEPNTWGGFIACGTTLSYFDRREPLPNLAGTALKIEPCYGLDVYYDISRPGPVRNITIRPIPYINSNLVVQYRIVITAPDNSQGVYLSDGSYVPYSSSVGWQQGQPKVITIPLALTGQYTINLQCLDQTGNITQDLFPYMNFDITNIVKSSVDVSNLISNIEGISFDFLGNLWLYDGIWAIPVTPIYNGYILDSDSRNIYLTDLWDQVIYS